MSGKFGRITLMLAMAGIAVILYELLGPELQAFVHEVRVLFHFP